MLARCTSLTSILALLGAFGLATAVQAAPKMYSGSLILHDFANDTTSGSKWPFATYTLQALPLGAYCNPANGGTSCGTATLHGGAPLTGSGTAMSLSGSPFGFRIDEAELRIETSGSLPPYPGVSYTLTDANLKNLRGIFSIGAGPGSFSFVPALGSGMTRAAVVAGKNKFGGVMKLVGRFGTRNAGSTLGGGRWYGDFPNWGWEVVGGSYAQMTTVMGSFTFTSPPLVYKSVAVVTGFPWTTGRASVSAAGGSGFPTKLVRSGYDNRTPGGGGTIQMVTPRLTHWAAGAHWGDIAVLRLQFVPEPGSWLLLVAGVGLLGALHRLRAPR